MLLQEKRWDTSKIPPWDFKISQKGFKVLIGVFFGLATLSLIARAAARFYFRRRVTLDDYFLFAAFLFLSASTGLVYNLADELYLWMVGRKDPALAFSINPEFVTVSLATGMQRVDPFIVCAWTAVALVKASFLAFFQQLIRGVSKIKVYYWFVVILTFVTWCFMVVQSFVTCPYFGMDAAYKCYGPEWERRNLIDVLIANTLDGMTDIMIVSIPVILLSRSRMRLSQKLVIAAFTCLSVFMVACAVARTIGVRSPEGQNIPWLFLWQYIEPSIAVLMGSLTIFRVLLTQDSKKRAAEREKRGREAGPRSKTWSHFRGRRQRNVDGGLSTGDLEIDKDSYTGTSGTTATESPLGEPEKPSQVEELAGGQAIESRG